MTLPPIFESDDIQVAARESGQFPPEPIPVLTLGGGLTALGVLRCLGRRKLPAFSICGHDGFDFSRHSRWYREVSRIVTARPRDLPSLLGALPIRHAVLMPCADDWLMAVSVLPPDLSLRFPSSVPPHQTVRSMVNKWEFAELLRSLAVPAPITTLVESCGQLEQLLPKHFEPQILKPLSSKTFRERHGVKGFVVATKADALSIADRIEFPIMLQRYIPGPATATYHIEGFVDRHGHICARFARQRLRLYPKGLGNSSAMRSVPLHQVAAALAPLERLLLAVSYRGIFNAEFKYDERDGQFKLIEINARPWWYIEFAANCGIDVAWFAYQDALGLSVSSLDQYETERRCIHFINDVQAFRARSNGDALTFWTWAKSVLGADDALFAWDDTGPAMATAMRALKRASWNLAAGNPQRQSTRIPQRV